MAQQQFFPGSPMRTLLLLFAGQTAELFNSQNVVSSTGTPGPYLPGSSTIKVVISEEKFCRSCFTIDETISS